MLFRSAFLRGCRACIGALFEAGKKVLERNHSGVGEHEGWVILRHERRRSHGLMFILFEEIEKGRPYLADAVHFVTPVVSIVIVGEPTRQCLPRKKAWERLARDGPIRASPTIRAQGPALLSKGSEVSLKAFSVREEKST